MFDRMLLFLVTIAAAARPALAQTLPPAQVQADARSYLAAIPIPGSTPTYFTTPSAAELPVWRTAVQLAWTGQAGAANYYADSLGYTLVEVQDATRGATYLVLREKAAPGAPGYRGLGYYVFRPDLTNGLVIEAPHPKFEINTEFEAIDAFLQVGARALFNAGIHRDNSPALSPCTNGTYRISDAAHFTSAFFAVAHEAMVDECPSCVAVQLHGYVSSGTEQFIMSEGFDAAPAASSFCSRLAWHLRTDAGYQVLVFPTDTQSLGATFNVEGRYSNGVTSDPCDASATGSRGTFVSVEQVLSVRKSYAPVIAAIAATKAEFWP